MKTIKISIVLLIIILASSLAVMVVCGTSNIAKAYNGSLPNVIEPQSAAEGGSYVIVTDSNQNDFSGSMYIPNSNYFINNPLHAVNDGSDSADGTCTTVAIQMLIGYFNYYMDRMLLPVTSELGIRFLSEDYGDLAHDPKYLHTTAAGQGDGCIGTQDGVYREIFRNTTLASEPGGQNFLFVIEGANRFLTANTDQDFKLDFGSYSEEDVKNSINSGTPIVLGMRREIEDGGKSYHVIVAYGYAYYKGEFGYIVHWGHDSSKVQVWTPAHWYAYQVSMKVRHTHNFTYDGDYDYEYRILKCNECGARLLDDLYYTNEAGDTILGAKYPPTNDFYEIPETINGKTITAIGNGAFANRNDFKEIYLPATIKSIGANAFEGCSALELCMLTSDSQLETIGNSAFFNSTISAIDFSRGFNSIGANAFGNCRNLKSVTLKGNNVEIGNAAFNDSGLQVISGMENVKSIGANAFENCSNLSLIYLNDGAQLTTIGNSAFASCPQLLNFVMPTTLISVGYYAFSGCTALEKVVIPNSVTTIGGGAFNGCENLTIYTSRANTPSGWVGGWNSLNRPIVLGCTLTGSTPYVTSFTKSASNPFNANAVNGLNNPYRINYNFRGWYTTADFSGTQYATIAEAPNGTLYAKWEESCVAEGTLITLADGTQKPVEQLTGDETLLVWNLNTGAFDVAPILFVDSDPRGTYEVINLSFSDGTTVKVISEHAFWDFDLNKYVYLDENASEYIGHWFNKQTTNEDGSMGYTRVQLVGVEVKNEQTAAYSPVTYGHLCYYVNGMLSMPGGISGLFNIFEVDAETLKIDEQKMQEDIKTYGLFTYEEFASIVPVSEEVFNAFNGQYLKVAIGKGMITVERLQYLVERYAEFFV